MTLKILPEDPLSRDYNLKKNIPEISICQREQQNLLLKTKRNDKIHVKQQQKQLFTSGARLSYQNY